MSSAAELGLESPRIGRRGRGNGWLLTPWPCSTLSEPPGINVHVPEFNVQGTQVCQRGSATITKRGSSMMAAPSIEVSTALGAPRMTRHASRPQVPPRERDHHPTVMRHKGTLPMSSSTLGCQP
jgi:hypothetical protein